MSYAWLAQSVEHETLNLRVVGSSPTLGVFSMRLAFWKKKSRPSSKTLHLTNYVNGFGSWLNGLVV